jgi:hypothetical protein
MKGSAGRVASARPPSWRATGRNRLPPRALDVAYARPRPPVSRARVSALTRERREGLPGPSDQRCASTGQGGNARASGRVWSVQSRLLQRRRRGAPWTANKPQPVRERVEGQERVPQRAWHRLRNRCGQCASGSGRSWKCTAMGFLPLPPSMSHGARSPLVVHRPRPFQPALASSIRPSNPLA